MQIRTLVTRASVVVFSIVIVSGCAGSPSPRIALNCAALIPPSVREAVKDVPPPNDNTLSGWVAVADARSGKIDDANRNTRYVVEQADLCQAEAERLNAKPWWKIF